MKLSSISLIAAALATIAGGVTAAPVPCTFEHVDSHATAEEHHVVQAEETHIAEEHHVAHHVAQAKEHQTSINLSHSVANEALGQHTIVAIEQSHSSIELNKMEHTHASEQGGAPGS